MMGKAVSIERINRIWAAICIVLVLALGGTLGVLIKVSSDRSAQRTDRRIAEAQLHTQAEIQGSCYFWRWVGTAPLPASVNALGLNLVAGVRIAYAKAECPGKLPPADPRVQRLLPPGVR